VGACSDANALSVFPGITLEGWFMSEIKIEANDLQTIIDYAFKVLTLVMFLYTVHKETKIEWRKKDLHMNSIESLFGSALTCSQVIMPQKQYYMKKHPLFPSKAPTFKSANIAAQAISDYIYMPFAEKVKRMTKKTSKPDFEKNLFTVGSTGGNKYVAAEFAQWNKKYDLRWTIEAPKEKDERVCRYSGGKLYSSPAYRIYDNEKEEYLQVRTKEQYHEVKNGSELESGFKSGNYPFLLEDYGLITKGPSCKAGSKKLEHVNLGGLHGLGIRSHDHFLKNTELLSKVSKVIEEENKSSKFYQILLPVKSIFHDRQHLESNPVDFGEPIVHILSANSAS
jgi:hypothetical protein